MIYQETLVTRWHDTDATLRVRPSMLLVYMQEMAFRHLDTVGKNLDKLRTDEGLAFILTRLSLRFTRPVGPYETLTASTWISPGAGIDFPRCFRLQNAAGATVAEGVSHWVLLDLATRRFVRERDFSYGFEAHDLLDLPSPRRIVLPDGMVKVGTRRIGYADIDYNGHMNNTRYPDMVCDFLPNGTVPALRTLHLSFEKEAPLGAVLDVFRGEREGEDGSRIYTLQTRNAAGEVCLAAEATTDKEALA